MHELVLWLEGGIVGLIVVVVVYVKHYCKALGATLVVFVCEMRYIIIIILMIVMKIIIIMIIILILIIVALLKSDTTVIILGSMRLRS